MTADRRHLSIGGSVLALALGFGLPATAQANQPPPGGVGGMPGGGMPGGAPAGGGASDDKDGPAEAAPKDKGALTPIVPVPAQPEGRRRLQLFELHGNLRMRADYFHRLDLALAGRNPDSTSNPDHQFFLPPAEINDPLLPNPVNCGSRLTARNANRRAARACPRYRGFGGGNMRLRLNPTIHVTDTVKVHAQVDLLDNLVLGSTPDSFTGESPWAPMDLFTRSMYPPAAGINSFNDSITVKRAWGEIRFGFGLTLEFGRMPNHWGLGIVQNDGNGYDRQEKGDIVRMVDTDYGDSVDSVRLKFNFGADKRRAITLGVSYDWAASGPTTAQILGPEYQSGNLVAQTLSAELYDNVHQFSAWVERHDDPSLLRRKLTAGTPVVNYGFKTWLRLQTLDRAIGSPGLGDGLGPNGSIRSEDDPDGLGHAGVPLGNGLLDDEDVDMDNMDDNGLEKYAWSLVHRRGWVLTPDLWLRVNWRTMRIETEAAFVIGNFAHRDPSTPRTDPDFDLNTVTADDRTRIVQFGYALEFKYGLFKDKFHIGVDHGFASGDSSPPYRNRYQSPFPATGGGYDNFGTFRFNPAYMQDLLLFKELLGTVANASYVKAWAAYYFFQNNVSARADVEFAGAVDKRGTVSGTSSIWGLELAASLRYHDAEEPIFFQLQYGAMFPFKAWNVHVAGQDQPYDAKAAQTIQAQLGVRF